jgi:hypothetical protein
LAGSVVVVSAQEQLGWRRRLSRHLLELGSDRILVRSFSEQSMNDREDDGDEIPPRSNDSILPRPMKLHRKPPTIAPAMPMRILTEIPPGLSRA